MVSTGTCQKCRSDIPIEAIRCPECGYEPGTLTGMKIVAIALTAIITYLAVWVLFMLVTGLSIDGVGPVDLALGFIVALGAAIVAAWWRYRQVTHPNYPTRPVS